MKILAIDDSMTARMIIKRSFEGHTVLEAPDGAVGFVSDLRLKHQST